MKTPTADKKLDGAAEHLRAAFKDLTAVALDQCEGTSEFTRVYLGTIDEVASALLPLCRKLNR